MNDIERTLNILKWGGVGYTPEERDKALNIARDTFKTLEILKKNFIVSCEYNYNDLPCLIIGIKTNEDKLVVIYETHNPEEFEVLKKVLL